MVDNGGGPKLEDFLGGSAAGAQFDGMPEMEMYDDSELKTIAASFLPGFSAEQTDNKQIEAAPPSDPPAKKAVESFGQRTSIFRGVTRYSLCPIKNVTFSKMETIFSLFYSFFINS